MKQRYVIARFGKRIHIARVTPERLPDLPGEEAFYCSPGKLVPTLTYLLAGSKEALRLEWLSYPSPFVFRSLPNKEQELRALLLDPARIWLDALLRALTDYAAEPGARVLVEDTKLASGLGEWLEKALAGDRIQEGFPDLSREIEDDPLVEKALAEDRIQEAPNLEGLEEGFRRLWELRSRQIRQGRQALLDLLVDILSGRSSSPVDMAAKVLRILCLSISGFSLEVVSPFDGRLNDHPLPNEARVFVLRLDRRRSIGASEAFWLGYLVAPIVLLAEEEGGLPKVFRVGFHNTWAAALRKDPVLEFDSEESALSAILETISSGGRA